MLLDGPFDHGVPAPAFRLPLRDQPLCHGIKIVEVSSGYAGLVHGGNKLLVFDVNGVPVLDQKRKPSYEGSPLVPCVEVLPPGDVVDKQRRLLRDSFLELLIICPLLDLLDEAP